MDHGGNLGYTFGVALDFGLESLDEDWAEYDKTDQVAENLLAIRGVRGGYFVRGKLFVSNFGIF